jgi:hypothetical protein
MDELVRAKAAYEAGGASELLAGVINYVRRPVETRTVDRTRFEVPYHVWKHDRRAKRFATMLSERGIGPRIDNANLHEYKSSDTLFVLGSGSSINDITDEQWDHIGNHDSIGLNRWPVHDFVPTYHVFETRLEPAFAEFTAEYWQLLDSRRETYEQIPVILKDVSTVYRQLEPTDLPSWLAGELIVSTDSSYGSIVTPDSTIARNEDLLQHLYESGHFDPGTLGVLYRKRGSISYLIHLGLCLGYERIVLCGVDMVDSAYFFDDDPRYEQREVPIPRPPEAEHDNRNDDETHMTNDPEVGQLTLEEVIYSIDELVLSPEGVSLYVENDRSALHPRIPLYPYS